MPHLTLSSPISPAITLRSGPLGDRDTQQWINRNEEKGEKNDGGSNQRQMFGLPLFPHACEGACDLAPELLLLEAADESQSIDMQKERG